MRRLRSISSFNWFIFSASVECAIETDCRIEETASGQMMEVMRFLEERVDPKMFIRIMRKSTLEYFLSSDESISASGLFWKEFDSLLRNNKAGRSKKSKLMKLLEPNDIGEELFTIFYIILVNTCMVEEYSNNELSMINHICKIYNVFSEDYLEAFLDVYALVDIPQSYAVLRHYYKEKLSGEQLAAFELYLEAYDGYMFTPRELELIDAAKKNLINVNKKEHFPKLVIMDQEVFRCCKEEVWDNYDG